MGGGFATAVPTPRTSSVRNNRVFSETADSQAATPGELKSS